MAKIGSPHLYPQNPPEPASSLDDLPTELVDKVCDHLTDPFSRLSLAATSRRMNSIVFQRPDFPAQAARITEMRARLQQSKNTQGKTKHADTLALTKGLNYLPLPQRAGVIDQIAKLPTQRLRSEASVAAIGHAHILPADALETLTTALPNKRCTPATHALILKALLEAGPALPPEVAQMIPQVAQRTADALKGLHDNPQQRAETLKILLETNAPLPEPITQLSLKSADKLANAINGTENQASRISALRTLGGIHAPLPSALANIVANFA